MTDKNIVVMTTSILVAGIIICLASLHNSFMVNFSAAESACHKKGGVLVMGPMEGTYACVAKP